MSYSLVGVASFNTAGSKTMILPLGGLDPNELTVTACARANTTETYSVVTQGYTDGTTTASFAINGANTRRFPYTSSPSYFFAIYNSSNVRVFSGTFTSWTSDEATINIDTCSVTGYSLIVKARTA